LNVEFEPAQQCHSDERVGIGFVDENTSRAAVPIDLRLVNVEEALNAIGQHAPIQALPFQAERCNRRRRYGKKTRKAGIDEGLEFL
jgi:hypothetical protein